MKEIEIPEGYEARIKGNKVIIEQVESEDERIRRELLEYAKGEVRSYDNMVSGDYDSRDKEDKMMHKWWKKIVVYLEKQKALSELGKYIASERTKPGFMFSGNDSVSWEELPLQVRKHDYPYYFIGDLDCYPFVVEDKKPVECSKNNKDKSILTILVDALKGNAQLEWELKSAGVDVKKLVAYIEEQTEELSTRLNGLMQEYVKSGKDEEEQEHRLKCYQLFWDALGDSEFFEQKEQKPILEVFGFKVGDAVRLKDGDGRKHIIKSFEEVEGIHGPNFYHVEFEDDLARDGIYPGEEYPNGYYTQMEKIEEKQKPAEWSDGDKDYYDAIIAKLEVTQDDAMLTDNQMDFLKSLPERLNLQPKQEWGEEDKKILDELLDHCNIENATWYNFLKSLRPQPKQEWSSEDERMLNVAIRSCEQTIKDYPNERVRFKDCISWLKSIRPQPHWKPSEKQMEALKNCAYGAFRNGDGPVLRELYNDLKKL